MLNLKTFLSFPRLQKKLRKRALGYAKKKIVSQIQTILEIRKGSRFSRLFRAIFEHKRIKAFVGGNLALLVLSASTFSHSVSALAIIPQTETATLSATVVELTTKQTVRMPLEETRLTQGFSFYHSGVDLDGVTGDPVYPAMEGVVESIVYDRFGLGKHIIINHGSGLKSVYAHLSKIEVEAGAEVNTKQVIGLVGSTGRSFGDHLHFELIEADRHLNPRTILPIK